MSRLISGEKLSSQLSKPGSICSKRPIVLLTMTLLLGSTSQAGVGAIDGENRVTTGAGIVRPTSFQAFFYNPAGVLYCDSIKLVLMIDTPDENDLDPIYYGVFGIWGNKKLAGGFGLRSLGGSTQYYASVAIALGKKGSMGVSGTYADTVFGISGTRDISAGILYKVAKKVQWGASVFNIIDGPRVLGTGLSFDASKMVRLAVDIGIYDDLSDPVIVPGVKFGTRKMAIGVNVGLELSNTGSNALPTGLNLAFDFTFGRSTTITVSYQQIDQIEADISFRF